MIIEFKGGVHTKNLHSDVIIKFNLQQEFIPLCTLNYLPFHVLRPGLIPSSVRAYAETLTADSDLSKRIKVSHKFNITNVSPSDFFERYMSSPPEEELSFGFRYGLSYAETFEAIFSIGLQESFISRTSLGRTLYGSGFLGMYDITDNGRGNILSLTPMFSIMIKKDKFLEIKRSIIDKTEISDFDVQLWVRKGFDHKDSPFQRLRTEYRKNVKSLFKKFQIFEKESFSLLFKKPNVPEFKTLDEKERFFNNFTAQFLSKEREKLKIPIKEEALSDYIL